MSNVARLYSIPWDSFVHCPTSTSCSYGSLCVHMYTFLGVITNTLQSPSTFLGVTANNLWLSSAFSVSLPLSFVCLLLSLKDCENHSNSPKFVPTFHNFTCTHCILSDLGMCVHCEWWHYLSMYRSLAVSNSYHNCMLGLALHCSATAGAYWFACNQKWGSFTEYCFSSGTYKAIWLTGLVLSAWMHVHVCVHV